MEMRLKWIVVAEWDDLMGNVQLCRRSYFPPSTSASASDVYDLELTSRHALAGSLACDHIPGSGAQVVQEKRLSTRNFSSHSLVIPSNSESRAFAVSFVYPAGLDGFPHLHTDSIWFLSACREWLRLMDDDLGCLVVDTWIAQYCPFALHPIVSASDTPDIGQSLIAGTCDVDWVHRLVSAHLASGCRSIVVGSGRSALLRIWHLLALFSSSSSSPSIADIQSDISRFDSRLMLQLFQVGPGGLDLDRLVHLILLRSGYPYSIVVVDERQIFKLPLPLVNYRRIRGDFIRVHAQLLVSYRSRNLLPSLGDVVMSVLSTAAGSGVSHSVLDIVRVLVRLPSSDLQMLAVAGWLNVLAHRASCLSLLIQQHEIPIVTPRNIPFGGAAESSPSPVQLVVTKCDMPTVVSEPSLPAAHTKLLRPIRYSSTTPSSPILRPSSPQVSTGLSMADSSSSSLGENAVRGEFSRSQTLMARTSLRATRRRTANAFIVNMLKISLMDDNLLEKRQSQLRLLSPSTMELVSPGGDSPSSAVSQQQAGESSMSISSIIRSTSSWMNSITLSPSSVTDNDGGISGDLNFQPWHGLSPALIPFLSDGDTLVLIGQLDASSSGSDYTSLNLPAILKNEQ